MYIYTIMQPLTWPPTPPEDTASLPQDSAEDT